MSAEIINYIEQFSTVRFIQIYNFPSCQNKDTVKQELPFICNLKFIVFDDCNLATFTTLLSSFSYFVIRNYENKNYIQIQKSDLTENYFLCTKC